MSKRKKRGKKYEDKRDWEAYDEKLVRGGEFYANPRFLSTWSQELKETNYKKAFSSLTRDKEINFV